MQQKGFAHLILLLVVGIALVGGYFLYQRGYIQINPTPNNRTTTTQTTAPSTTNIQTSNSPTPMTDITDNWKIYTNTKYSFSIKHPKEWKEPANQDYGFIGKRVYFSVYKTPTEGAHGDGPVEKSFEKVTIATLPATRSAGYVGEIGGNIPQNYVEYTFQKNGYTYMFTLYALDNDTDIVSDGQKIWPLKDADVKLFEQIISTFKFTN